MIAVEGVLGDPLFRMIEVPDGPPRTKPKAIDYALPLARGKYLVVYDAEDVPEPGQLRLAASRFEADTGLACLQAELVPENASENALTALFAGEYAGLFGRLLPALARWGLPMPLGGTSNHFRTCGAARDRRLGRVQCHRGRRSRRAASPARAAGRDVREPHVRGSAGDVARLDGAADALDEGLDAPCQPMGSSKPFNDLTLRQTNLPPSSQLHRNRFERGVDPNFGNGGIASSTGCMPVCSGAPECSTVRGFSDSRARWQLPLSGTRANNSRHTRNQPTATRREPR